MTDSLEEERIADELSDRQALEVFQREAAKIDEALYFLSVDYTTGAPLPDFCAVIERVGLACDWSYEALR